VRVLTIVFQDDAGPGVFADVARERGAELVRWTPSRGAPPLPAEKADALLVLGGAVNPDQEGEHAWLRDAKRLVAGRLEDGTPTLGVCLGAELIAEVAGGRAVRMPAPQIGWCEMELEPAARADPLLSALPSPFASFQWHSYRCEPPPAATALAREGDQLDAFRIGDAWGVQFHPEVTAEIVAAWLGDWRSDGDAVAAGFDPALVAAETPRRIEAANAAGRAIFARFLDHAGRTPSTA